VAQTIALLSVVCAVFAGEASWRSRVPV